MYKHHYDRKIARSIPYGRREGYRDGTQDDLDNQRTIYFKTTDSYGGHRCIKGIIVKGDDKRPTKISTNYELFVVRNKL